MTSIQKVIAKFSFKNGQLEEFNQLLLSAKKTFDNGFIEDAIVEYDKMTVKYSSYAILFYNLGLAFYHKGKMDEAIENYKNAIHLKPDYADAYCNQGMSFKEKGDFDAALKCYKSAIKINGHHLGSFYNLGDIFNTQDRLTIALKYYKRVIKLEPDYEMPTKAKTVTYIPGKLHSWNDGKTNHNLGTTWPQGDRYISI